MPAKRDDDKKPAMIDREDTMPEHPKPPTLDRAEHPDARGDVSPLDHAQARAMAHGEPLGPEHSPIRRESPEGRTVEDLLADRTFAPPPGVRERLAAYSLEHGVGSVPPADLLQAP